MDDSHQHIHEMKTKDSIKCKNVQFGEAAHPNPPQGHRLRAFHVLTASPALANR